MDYKQTAADALKKVGGKENIVNAGHCATRLRLTLKDDENINVDDVKKIKGVVGCVNKGGQFQVIIGNDVTFVYDELMKMIGTVSASSQENEEEEKKSFWTRAINYISGSVFPIIPALVGGGLVKAVLALLAAFSLVDRSGTTYQMLNLIGDAPFYFLPVIIGFSAPRS